MKLSSKHRYHLSSVALGRRCYRGEQAHEHTGRHHIGNSGIYTCSMVSKATMCGLAVAHTCLCAHIRLRRFEPNIVETSNYYHHTYMYAYEPHCSQSIGAAFPTKCHNDDSHFHLYIYFSSYSMVAAEHRQRTAVLIHMHNIDIYEYTSYRDVDCV